MAEPARERKIDAEQWLGEVSLPCFAGLCVDEVGLCRLNLRLCVCVYVCVCVCVCVCMCVCCVSMVSLSSCTFNVQGVYCMCTRNTLLMMCL